MIERSGLCHSKALNLLFLNTVLNTACSDLYGRYCSWSCCCMVIIFSNLKCFEARIIDVIIFFLYADVASSAIAVVVAGPAVA